MAGHLFVFGLGYSARLLAQELLAEGWTVAGTCRSDATAAELAGLGIEAVPFDRARPLADAAGLLARTTHLLSSVPPDGRGDPVLSCHGAAIGGAPKLRWIGYLSTTGVYGDRQGGWVDEHAPRRPTGARGRRRVLAENAWFALGRRCGVPVHSFRLAGIYGPGRSALETVRRGRARRLVKPGQVFSRIHVADIAQVLRASIAAPSDAGRAYNVCDDEAAPPQEVIRQACALLGVTPPPEEIFDPATLSPMARSFYRDNKRVSNQRIKAELGVTLRYAHYRDGLAALLAGPPSRSESPVEPR